MTMQQWVNVMRSARCVIVYLPIGRSIDYVAKDRYGNHVGYWHPESNNGSIIMNGHIVMSWEFT